MRYFTAAFVLFSVALAGCGKTDQEPRPYSGSSALEAIQNPVQDGAAASAASATRK